MIPPDYGDSHYDGYGMSETDDDHHLATQDDLDHLFGRTSTGSPPPINRKQFEPGVYRNQHFPSWPGNTDLLRYDYVPPHGQGAHRSMSVVHTPASSDTYIPTDDERERWERDPGVFVPGGPARRDVASSYRRPPRNPQPWFDGEEPQPGAPKLFGHAHTPAQAKVESFFGSKESRAMTGPMLGIAQSDAVRRWGTPLQASSDLSHHSSRLANKLGALGAHQGGSSAGVTNNYDFDEADDLVGAPPEGERVPDAEVDAGRRLFRHTLRAGRPRPDKSEQQRLF